MEEDSPVKGNKARGAARGKKARRASSKGVASKNKKTEPVESTEAPKTGRAPGPSIIAYKTRTWKRYEPHALNPEEALEGLRPVSAAYTKMEPYHHYLLYNETGPYSWEDIPQRCIKLDDLACATILEQSEMSGKKLNRTWPADIDMNGMPRAQRTPLGWAGMVYVLAGMEDADGNVATTEQKGFFHKWWGGIHCLGGDEVLNAGRWVVCPSGEKFKCEGMSWKISSKAASQVSEEEESGILLIS